MTYRFSVISPMYNVARYLPEFFESLERQTFPFEGIEVILVDDGSTDETAGVAEAFAARHPENVRVLRKPNGGQASARNLGLAAATGEWVTFPDPDDVLSDSYFGDLSDFMDSPEGAGADAYSARIRMWFEASGAVRNSHALDARFRSGPRVVDLNEEPRFIQPHATSAVYRRSVIERAGLTFPETLRLRFEDAAFTCKYFLSLPRPRVGFVPSAHYLYRQRADQSSTIQSSQSDPRKYTDTIRYGFLDVIDYAGGGELPQWLENIFLYDVFWIFRSSRSPAVRRAQFPASMYDELDELMPAWLAHVRHESIDAFDVMYASPWMKDAVHLLKDGSGHGPLHFGSIDAKRGLVSLVYRYRGDAPQEVVTVGGKPAEVRYAKDWSLEYVGRPVVWQRYIWIALDASITVELDGVPQVIRPSASAEGVEQLDTEAISTQAVAAALRAEPPATAPKRLRRIRRRTGILLRELKAIWRERPPVGASIRRVNVAWRSMSPALARRFLGAWVFIDRDVDANDSAEILYKWVAKHHPEINSWFVLRPDSVDWDRLAAEGVRLVAYGSAEFAALVLAAEHIASSHADRFITDPLPKRLGRRSWNFTFLQHGVIKGDISGWLNSKRIATFVTSTQDEYAYVAGPSPFRFGAKEVRLTGLPRFDALLEQDAAVADEERDVVLFMPTWRDYLVGAMTGTSRDRAAIDAFHETTYARAVQEFLTSDTLRRTVEARGLRVVFMPHPNMRMYLDSFTLPDFATVASYDDVDVRDMIARARVLVTDYSSVAFNMAYVRRPVVYFQFDREEYFAGHTERPGYFTYDTHGFGPVAETADDAAKAVEAGLDGTLPAVYAQRMADAFPVRDGQNSRRVYEAMLESRTSRPLAERMRRAPLDTWETLQGP